MTPATISPSLGTYLMNSLHQWICLTVDLPINDKTLIRDAAIKQAIECYKDGFRAAQELYAPKYLSKRSRATVLQSRVRGYIEKRWKRSKDPNNQ